jgi:hypothetical protein
MVEKIFSALPGQFVPGSVSERTSYYFSIDETRKTVLLGPDGCTVEDGRTIDSATCVCKTSSELFLKIWHQGYRPGMKDFLSGAIKSNNPAALQIFLGACGKTP